MLADYTNAPQRIGIIVALYGGSQVVQDSNQACANSNQFDFLASPFGLEVTFAKNVMDPSSHTAKMIILVPVGSVVCAGASYLVAKILLALNHDFGAGDMPAFLYWTALFAIALVLPALAFVLLARNARIINRIWIGTLLGGVAGLGWTLLNLVMLGPWFGAWSFNVLYCWIAGGAAGIFVIALFDGTQGWAADN